MVAEVFSDLLLILSLELLESLGLITLRPPNSLRQRIIALNWPTCLREIGIKESLSGDLER